MSGNKPWSTIENDRAVESYFAMLERDLRGEKYIKAEYNRRLVKQLGSRDRSAVEWKWRNISAILNELRFPSIAGYKSAPNYQDALLASVEVFLETHPEVHELAAEQVDSPVLPSVKPERLLTAWQLPPKPDPHRPHSEHPPKFERKVGGHIDYLARESRNAALGAAGEDFVLRFERQRLVAEGKKRLAEQIIHVSKEVGDWEGYDIHSFDNDGAPRLIEVKTTAFGPSTPFYMSAAEERFSRANVDNYWVYRLYAFRRIPRLFGLRGPVDQHCSLSPTQFIAKLHGWEG